LHSFGYTRKTNKESAGKLLATARRKQVLFQETLEGILNGVEYKINDPAKDTLPNIQYHQQTDRTETVCLGKQGISRKSAGNSRKKAGSVPGKQAVAD
jgi:glycogen synthase